MKSSQGNYVFTLDLVPNAKDGHGYVKGVAVHNRNGINEVIELTGVLYADNSIYLFDDGDISQQVKDGQGFSRLQFLFKFDGSDPVLDGHWQEYHDFRRYRKGRLVLKKTKRKAGV